MTEKPERIYLDHNATTPVDPRVLEKMIPYFTKVYGNAASKDHLFGLEAKRAVDEARKHIAKLINGSPEDIIFTSGATESDNIALFGVAEKYADKGDHIITAVTEHKAILDCCKRLEQMGKRVTYLKVDEYGRVSPEDVQNAITPRTILISIMAANNEIGTIAPVAEIGQIAAENNIIFHSDAAQAFGHISLDVKAMNIHLMSLSGHKIYGPKGIGVLYRRSSNPRVELEPVIYGGGHERGIRSGTLNVPGIVGFGEAARIAKSGMHKEAAQYKEWTKLIFNGLKEAFGDDFVLNGHPTERLPNNLNISIKGIESRALIVELHDRVALATGSACTSANVTPSHVISALGFGDELAHSAVRISVGRFQTNYQIQNAVKIIKSALEELFTLQKML